MDDHTSVWRQKIQPIADLKGGVCLTGIKLPVTTLRVTAHRVVRQTTSCHLQRTEDVNTHTTAAAVQHAMSCQTFSNEALLF